AAVGARQSLQNLSSCSPVKCRVRPRDQNENRSATSNATIGCPMKCRAVRVRLVGPRATSAALESSIRITGINTVITEIQKPGVSWVESPPSWEASGLTVRSGTRGAIHDAKKIGRAHV